MLNLELWASWANILALPVAVVAVILSIWFYNKSKSHRNIACEIDPIFSPIVIETTNSLSSDIQILYKNKPIQNIFVVRAKLTNTGNIPLRKSDFYTPITFVFEPEATLLRQPEVVIKSPPNIKVDWIKGDDDSYSSDYNKALDIELLNPREEITVEFICSGKSSAPSVVTRIDGVKEIDTLDETDRKLLEEFRFYRGYLIVAPALILVMYVFNSSLLWYDPSRIGPAVVVLGIVLLIASISLWRSYSKLYQYRKQKRRQ